MTRKHVTEDGVGVTFDGPLIPFGAKANYNPISSKGEQGCINLTEDASRNIYGFGIAEDGEATCSSRTAETWKNLSGSEMYINKFKHPGVPCESFRVL